VLSIASLSSFATNWLVPGLGAFQIAHPETAVKLDVLQELVEFARAEVDVGIRTGGGAIGRASSRTGSSAWSSRRC
jgi:LysR family glycine cleavage system transcriptional activator